MKFLSTFIAISFSIIALANSSELLSTEDFRNMSEFRYNWVIESERIFTDDIQQEDLYKVTYYIEGECDPHGESDACEQIETCEYVWIDTYSTLKEFYYPRFTDVQCSEDIELVLKPNLFDEL